MLCRRRKSSERWERERERERENRDRQSELGGRDRECGWGCIDTSAPMMETASEEGGKVSVTSIWNTLRDKRIVTPETISRSLQKLLNKQNIHNKQHYDGLISWEESSGLAPMIETASDVGGIVSANCRRKTVKDRRIVTPGWIGKSRHKVISQHFSCDAHSLHEDYS
ncbi:hypothetical protein CEXT_1831 [Caerostris extrusa]|uniref:Uncharacterized protein n=1 Tax=Caerostris extrusa TaxID=172846 RepID=A0AAV4S0W6_CAEEX|nr:hypothetical protein CEXT_1831 [Caerostris extrusa]